MVRITWQRDTSKILEVSAADGPGEYTDDVEPSDVREALDSLSEITEELVAGTVLDAYNGRLSEFDCHVTCSTSQVKNDSVPKSVTIAFVELDDPEDKFSHIVCDGCGFSPANASEWETEFRDTSGWMYEDWLCPDCDTVAHTALIA
jgi:hypothetical protein